MPQRGSVRSPRNGGIIDEADESDQADSRSSKEGTPPRRKESVVSQQALAEVPEVPEVPEVAEVPAEQGRAECSVLVPEHFAVRVLYPDGSSAVQTTSLTTTVAAAVALYRQRLVHAPSVASLSSAEWVVQVPGHAPRVEGPH